MPSFCYFPIIIFRFGFSSGAFKKKSPYAMISFYFFYNSFNSRTKFETEIAFLNKFLFAKPAALRFIGTGFKKKKTVRILQSPLSLFVYLHSSATTALMTLPSAFPFSSAITAFMIMPLFFVASTSANFSVNIAFTSSADNSFGANSDITS